MAGSGGAYGELLATSLIVLVAVCVLAFIVVRLARRYLGAPRDAHGLLAVIARVPLEPRRSLYVVEVAGKALLVGTSEMGLTVLSELDRDQVHARPVTPRQSFVEMVQSAWARRKSASAPVTVTVTVTVTVSVTRRPRVSASGWDWVGLALVALVPLVALALTSFVKISVVLSLLRNAFGTPDAPSGLVVMALSLILTVFVMAPVGAQMIDAANTVPAPSPPSPTPPHDDLGFLPPQIRDRVPAIERALVPLEDFLTRHASEPDRATFTRLAGELGRPAQGDELWVLAPAFVTTELKEAFAIAVLLFIPFLVIDLVVGLSLAALGLNTTSPSVVALPLKLLLFVAIDGWRLVVEGLVRGYA